MPLRGYPIESAIKLGRLKKSPASCGGFAIQHGMSGHHSDTGIFPVINSLGAAIKLFKSSGIKPLSN